uniref:Tetratricopeptide repeat protein n=1 Tax=Desulfovibrio sp. U5L TaxID=596152 RepID=I2PZK1_9BACT
MRHHTLCRRATARLFRSAPALAALAVVCCLGGVVPASCPAAGPTLAAIRAPDVPGGEALPGRGETPLPTGDRAFRVELKKSAPGEGAIRVGGAASFEARLFSGDREMAVDGSVCRWRSDGGARFLETEGPFATTAVFLRPGRQRVWVEVVPRSGPSPGLTAVSEPVELDIAAPSFSLSVTPASPLVGEEATVSIRDFPVHDGVEFRWDPLPAGKAKLVAVGERSLTFYPTEAGVVPVRVAAATAATDGGRAAGGNLGGAEVAVTARPYAVAVEDRGLLEAPATVWRDGEGPVPAPGVAVRQNVRLRAVVTPTPPSPPLAYAWSLCPGARVRGGEDGREIAVSRDALGPCEAGLEVRDGRGLLLGRGKGSFTVSVSQEELDAAVANARETDRRTRAAQAAWADGEPDKALELAGQAVRLSPRDGPALIALDRIGRDKARLDGYLAKAGAALSGDDFSEVAAMLGEAAKVSPRAGAIEALRRKAGARKETLGRVDALLAEGRDKWDAGDVDAGLALSGQALSLDAGHPAARAQRERMVADRDRLIAALKQSAAYLLAKRFDSAAGALAEARAVNPKFAAVRELEKAIAARKDRAWRMDERLARARDQWDAGDADGALATLAAAAALDPEHGGAATTRKNLVLARENLAHAEERAEAAIAAGTYDAARAALAEAAGISPRHPKLAALAGVLAHRLDRDKRLAALRAEAAKRQAAGDADGAILALNDMLALTPGDPAVTAERDKLARSRDAATEALGRARDYLSARRFDLALGAVAEAQKASPGLPALAGWREKIQAGQKLAEAEAAKTLDEAAGLLAKKDFAAAAARLDAARAVGPLPDGLAGKARDLDRRVQAGLTREAEAKRETARRDTAAGRPVDAERRARCEAAGREAAAKRAAGDHAGAIRDYQSLLNQCPDTCQAYNNVGASLFSLGYAAESLPWFTEAVKCAPDERLYQDNAALTRKKLSGPPAKAGRDTAASCAASFAAAETKRGGGDLAGAIEGYRTVVARCPDFCAAYNNMGLSLHKLGRPAESLPFFEQALRCNPRDALFKDNYEMTVKRLRTAERTP